MKIDRSAVWIAMCDMTLAVLSVCLVAVHPAQKTGLEQKVEYVVTADWDVNVDADVDLWIMTPRKMPAFYSSKSVGCVQLDQDNRGFSTGHVTLGDGSIVKIASNKETMSLRCIEPGQYDAAINMFAFNDKRVKLSDGLKVHFEIIEMNPVMKVVFSKDVVLNRPGQTINIESFTVDSAGKYALVDPPLELVTATAYRNGTPTGAASSSSQYHP